MTRSPAPLKRRANWPQIGAQMMAVGDYRAALQAFAHAAQAEKSVAAHRYHMGVAHFALNETGPAAQRLTEALRLKPQLEDAARQLGQLIATRPLPADVEFDRVGLRAALEYDRINREQVAEAAVYFLARLEPLSGLLELGRTADFLTVARQMCLKSTSEILKDDLLQKALSDNIVRMPDLEHLLVSLRRVLLLELPPERYNDRPLMAFVAILLRQCWLNEYVWPTCEEEEVYLAGQPFDLAKARAGDPIEGVRLMLAALYQPVGELVSGAVTATDLAGLRPNAVRDAILPQLIEQTELRARAASVRQLAPIADETSRKVAAQYEGNPYPRWTSLGLRVDHRGWKELLKRPFSEDRLAFMDSPFEVLIAGCGTGVQAVAAALAYGPNARITAIDLSASSLAYAQRMAEKFGAQGITFLQGDILALANRPDFHNRFQVIECTGVLHHMADPLAGWRTLNTALAVNGIMLIALYSEIARRQWTALKHDPAFPGEHCDIKALRLYRTSLFRRPDAELGAEFKGLRDLYTTSGFRDLILHVSEARFTLPEISSFLEAESLVFRGFFSAKLFDRLKTAYPEEDWPGRLDRWAAYEAAHPSTFAGMYYFWCERQR